MSTRSAVMVQMGNQVKAIYVHQDGYPSGVGKKLNTHFNSQQLAEALIENGNRSSIDDHVVGALQQIGDKFLINEDCARKLMIQFYREIDPDVRLDLSLRFTNYDEPAATYESYQRAITDWCNGSGIQFCYYWNGNNWFINNYQLPDVLAQISKDYTVTSPVDISSSEFYDSWKSKTIPLPAQL